MASTINATTSSGIVATADNTGSLALQSAGTTAATFNTYGMGLGSAVPSSGVGITFPAAQSASSDANTLDDYEEGTWTPTIAFGGGTTGITYNSQIGTYVKIGKMIHIQAYVYLSSKGSSTGAMTFRNFPFTSQNVSGAANSLSVYCGSATSVSGSYMVFINNNSTSADFYFSQTGTAGIFSNTNCNNTSDFIISGTYITAS